MHTGQPINRSNIEIPLTVSSDIIQKTQEQSSIMRLARKIELPGGGGSFEVAPHNGEEFGYVMEGTVSLVTDGKRNVLRKGETFYLHGRTFHTLKNEHKTTAKVLWVSTPPLF